MTYNKKVHQLVLLQKNGDSYTPYVNGVLLDSGDKDEYGDLIQGDNIYSTKLTITPEEEGELTLVARVQNGDTWEEVSLPITLRMYESISTEQAEEAANQTESLVVTVQQLQAQGKTTEEVQELVIEQLQQAEDVVAVGASETSDKVWYALQSGALGAVSIDGSSTAVRETLANETINTSKITNTSVGNKKVAIYSAHGQSTGATLADAFSESDFTVDYFQGDLATVESFKKMFEYGTIVFDTQGAALFKGDFTEVLPTLSDLYNNQTEQVVFYTGEAISVDSLQQYSADLKTGRLVIIDGYYAITPAFVQYYGQDNDFADSLVYANSPFSFTNNTMAEQFLNYKAQAYVGVESATTNNALSSFNNLLKGELLDEALNGEKLVGNGKLSYAKSALLANGDLENGKGYWISGGHFDTVTKLGVNENDSWTTINPTKGKYMGIISSGVDETALNGRQSWVYQTFYVPEDMNVLKFDYNVVSNEPMEFLGSGYDDTFKATIVEGAVKEPKEEDYNYEEEIYYEDYSIYNASWLASTVDVNETIIAYESVNSSDWGQNYENGGRRVDVVFGDGDETTYMTGWKTQTFDVSEYQGKSITLKLQTWDLGDTAYPTAVLFDNVRLTNSTLKGITIDGVTEALIPKYNEVVREYQFNAVHVDQYGDKIAGDISLRLDENGYRQPVIEQQATFSLKEAVEGVSIDAQTGILTIDNSASVGEITIVATGKNQVVEHTVKLKVYNYTKEKDEALEYINYIVESVNSLQNSDESFQETYIYELANVLNVYGYLIDENISTKSYDEQIEIGGTLLPKLPSEPFESFEEVKTFILQNLN